MARQVVLAVKDVALGAFLPPIVCPAVGLAVRSFADDVNSGQSPASKHPGDFELFQLGEFDDIQGVFIQDGDHPKLVCRARDLVNKGEK